MVCMYKPSKRRKAKATDRVRHCVQLRYEGRGGRECGLARLSLIRYPCTLCFSCILTDLFLRRAVSLAENAESLSQLGEIILCSNRN